jgi:hypothetical protein
MSGYSKYPYSTTTHSKEAFEEMALKIYTRKIRLSQALQYKNRGESTVFGCLGCKGAEETEV